MEQHAHAAGGDGVGPAGRSTMPAATALGLKSRGTAERHPGAQRAGRGRGYGLNFPKSCGSIFSRYCLSLSASSVGSGAGSSASTPLCVEQLLAREDRCPHPEGQRDAVRRPGVHLEDVVVAADEQLGEVGILLDRADEHAPQVPAEPHEYLLEEIVRKRPLRLHPLQLHRDGAGLRRPDPDGEYPAALLLAQDDDRRVGRPVESEVGHGDFDHVGNLAAKSRPALQVCPLTSPRPSSPGT